MRQRHRFFMINAPVLKPAKQAWGRCAMAGDAMKRREFMFASTAGAEAGGGEL
jgi:hypothetical protein